MSAIEAENALDTALNGGKVHRKSNRTGSLKSRASRVANHSSEVMVKITGFGKGARHVKSHIDYIARNGKVELETDQGELLAGKAAVADLFKSWAADLNDTAPHKRQRDTLHMVLSMPEGTPEEAVRHGARAFARETFGKNHEYVFALHTDEPHPHVHITVRMLGLDGRRLNPRKADLQEWRDAFALSLRDQGVDAEATPRAVRGVVRKAERSVLRHIEQGDEHHPPRISRVRAAKTREAADELIAEAAGQPVAEKPWEARIRERQQATRSAWLAAAAVLDANATPTPTGQGSPRSSDRDLASSIRTLVGAMPSIDTERHELKRQLISRFTRQRDRSNAKDVNLDQPAANGKDRDLER